MISYDEENCKVTFIESTDDGDVEHVLPGRYVLCGACEGRGKHDHPAFSNGITQEQFNEDPDFREDYFSGRYDVVCRTCNGKRVVCQLDRSSVDKRLLDEIDFYYEMEAAHEVEAAAERRAFGYY